MEHDPVDTLPPDQMSRWIRETAEHTRARCNGQWTGNEVRVAKHVAFRLGQAADQIDVMASYGIKQEAEIVRLRWLIKHGERHFGSLWREATAADIDAAKGAPSAGGGNG